MKTDFSGLNNQKGFTLIELLVAATISLIAITGMVLMMSNTIGTTTDTIANARLTNELRSAMMLLTRDLRRANISDSYMECIATGDVLCPEVIDTVSVTSGASGCVGYSYERLDGTAVSGAFRLSNGVLQMRTDATSCADSANSWQALTDGDVMTIDSFLVEETSGAELGYTQAISANLSQRVRKLRFTLEGTICHARDANGCTQSTTRSVSNVVRIRNDIMFDPTP